MKRGVAVIIFLAALAFMLFSARGEDVPPYQRTIQGENAKKAGELKLKVNELKEADRYAEAIQVAEELLALLVRVQGKDHYGTVNERWNTEVLKKVSALPADQRAEWRAAFGRVNEAIDLEAKGRFTTALPLRQKLLALSQKVLGEEHPHTATGYNNVGMNLNGQGNYAAAEPLILKALGITQKVLGEDHPGTGLSYNNVGFNLRHQGKNSEAERFYSKALIIRQKTLGEEHPDTAQSYNNLAFSLYAQGKYAKAEPVFLKALAMRQKVLGEEHRNTADGYDNVALVLDAQAKYAAAEPIYAKALAIRQKVLGEEHPDTAFSYNNLGANLNAQGRYATAEPLMLKALAIFKEVLGDAHPHTATSYDSLAVNLGDQGKYAEAEPHYLKALSIRQKVLGEEHFDTAKSYNNVAANLVEQGKYAAAEPYMRKALAIDQKVLGEDHPSTALGYNNVASLLGTQGRYSEAEPLLIKAMAICRKVVGEDHAYTAQGYSELAFISRAQGRYVAAELLYSKALAIHLRVFGEEHPDTSNCYNNVALMMNVLGKYDVAESKARASVTALEAARLRGVESGLGRATAQRFSPRLTWAAALLRTGQVAQAWQVLEGHFGRGLLDAYSAKQALSLTPDEQKELAGLNVRFHQFDRQITSLLAAKGGINANREQFEALVRERKAAESELAQFAAKLQQKEIYDLKLIQSRLPADGALVGWIEVSYGQDAPSGSLTPIGGEHWAFLLKAKGNPIVVELKGSGEKQAWTKKDDELPGQAGAELSRSPKRERGTEQTLADASGSEALYRQRFGPLEPHLKDVRHLIALPSEAMAGIPLEALTDRFTISYAPSGTLFAKLVESRKAPLPDGRGSDDRRAYRLLALGDPAFLPTEKPRQRPTPPDHGLLLSLVAPNSNAAKSGLKAGDVLLQYAGSKLTKREDLALKQEGEAVPVQVWRDGQTLTVQVQPGPLGVRFDPRPAAEAMVAMRALDDQLARSARGSHVEPLPGTRREIAGIASLFENKTTLLGAEASRQSLDRIGRGDELKTYQVLHFATHGRVNRHVALSSALILAAEQPADAPQRNGQLSASEMLDQWKRKLNADLVVLSACETGLGKKAPGEGYLGFSQALFLAGARSIILSQWQVSDTATALLMVRFYENWLGRRAGLRERPESPPMSKAEALKEAKHWLRNLTRAEAEKRLAHLPEAARGLKLEGDGGARSPVNGDKPFEHPYYWSAFILIGDPN